LITVLSIFCKKMQFHRVCMRESFSFFEKLLYIFKSGVLLASIKAPAGSPPGTICFFGAGAGMWTTAFRVVG